MGKVAITPSLVLDESEIQIDYVRAAGPGGQNVNKVSSAAQLRFNVRASPNLPEDVKERLIALAGSRVTAEGVLIIEARQFRTQEQNRAEALLRLIGLIRRAAQPPKPRRKTRPSMAAKAARLEEKRRRSAIKRLRRYHPEIE